MIENSRPDYTAEDFIRYHRGEMSAAEMHQLERAALEDPFISDALDGYAYVQEKMKPVDAFIPSSANPTTAVIKPMRKWLTPLSMAASILVLFLSGYFIFQPKEKEIKEDSVTMTTSVPAQSAVTDSLSPVKTAPEIQGDFSEKEAKELAAIVKKDLKNKQAIVTKSTVSAKPAVAASVQAPSVEANADVAVVEKKTAAEDLDKIADASGTGDLSNYSVAADKNLQSNFNDSAVFVSAAPAKAKMKLPAPVIANNNNNNASTWTNNGQALNEVVVTGYATNRKKQFSSARTTISAKDLSEDDEAPQVQLPAPSPNNGWDDLNDYLKKNLQSCTDKTGNIFHGKVTISFYIDTNGTPVKIKSKSLSPNCLNEAKRLLLAGPIWNGDPNKKATVTLEW